jgi:asparagine synthase (glutamine-hydrolysing)
MCGVVAIYHHDQSFEFDEKIIENMNNSQHHRGPDDHGVFIGNGIALAHTRLSIIAINDGHQPLFDKTNTVGITYNGEIYNYQELRNELINLGYQFNTQSDTEVIVNAWREWQTDCVKKFNGMFAFVLFDKTSQQLFAARDRLGVKPLHWTKTNDNQIIFASEIKALKRHPDIQFDLNYKSIEDFLSLGYIIEPKSIYASINKLESGHYILLDQKTPDAFINQCYWNVKDFIHSETKNYDIEKIHQQLSLAVKKRMIADVPLGAFLSGGIDSTAIVALMNQLSADKIITSSIGFDLSQYDESYFAEKVAQHFDTDHATTNVSVNDLSLVDLVVDIYDEPFADNSAIPTLILSKVTREKVKVALSGDGSDELFFGYRNYQMINMEEKLRRFFPAKITKPLFTLLAKYYPKLDKAPRFLRAKSTFQALASDPITSFHNAMSLSNVETLNKLYSYQFKDKLNGYSSLKQFRLLAKEVNHLSPLKQIQYIDFKTYLPGDILTKVDRASMASSLEVRVPFLDYKLVEWGLGVNEKLNIKGKKVKQILAKSLKGLVPKFVLERDKMGFTSPLDEWIRQIPKETLEKRIFSEALIAQNIFNIRELKSLIAKHQSRTINNGVLIWGLLILASFLKRELKQPK